MKHVLGLLSICCLLLGFSSLANAQNTQNFTISSFNANYVLSKSQKGTADMQVDEYIRAQFPNFDQNHGILRAIPLTYNGTTLGLKIIAVDKKVDEQSPSANNWTYSTSEQNGNLVLKIGDANQYVRNEQDFHISYNVHNVARSFDGYDEIFWNVNGTQWQQSMVIVTGKIIIPADIAANVTKQICYTGVSGSKAQNCTITSIPKSDGSIEINTASTMPLSVGENLSFAIAFKPGTFVVAKPTLWQRLAPILPFVIAIAMPLITVLFVIRGWRKQGRDPKGRGTIVPEYQPSKEASLAMQDFVFKESGRPLAISAQLINLAIRGYLQVIDEEKDKLIGSKHEFSLKLVKPATDITPEEQKVIEMVFDDINAVGTTKSLKDLSTKLYTKVAALWKQVGKDAVTAGYFVSEPQKAVKKYAMYGGLFVGFGFFATFFGQPFGIGLGIGSIISGVICFAASKFMPARTVKGVTLREYLEGLKLYIKMAEQDRIKFHQSPENAERQRVSLEDPAQKVKLFEDLLPYAMLFGLEKDWGKQFESLYQTPPNWYSGNMNGFNAAYLASNLNGFSTASATSFAAPSSSGGSGFSGGSSGGGGGGGGGGGW